VAALTGLATGLSVLAPFFILANGAGSIAYFLVAWKLPMRSWAHHLLAQVAANAAGNLFVAIGLRVLLHLHRAGLTVVLVTHDEAVAARYATRVVRLANGTIVNDSRNPLAP